jgi:predicted transcriptional regulator
MTLGTDLKLSTFLTQTVGKLLNMKESVVVTTSAHYGGTFVMNEGKALLLIMACLVLSTLILNAIVYTVLFT